MLQVWDLRNAFAPVKELVGHSKGILSASWCPNDSSLLVSSSKDSRIICWNPHSAEIISELPAGQNWTFDVRWSPKMPAILSCSSFDGEISVYSLQDSGTSAAVPSVGVLSDCPLASRTAHVPRWLKRPCGVTFGFGGKLAYFNSAGVGLVNLLSVITDDALVESSNELSAAVESRDLAGFCHARSVSAPTQRDKLEWSLLQVLASAEQRLMLLSYLGLSQEEQHEELTTVAAVRGPEEQAPAPSPSVDSCSQGAVAPAVEHLPSGDAVDPAELFSQLAVKHQQAQTSPGIQAVADGADAAAASFTSAVTTASTDATAAETAVLSPAQLELKLARAMLNGNFFVAVQCCLEAGRVADALVLAASGGPELWTQTRDRYLASISTPFMNTLSAVVHHDFEKFVTDSDLANWKETLALVNTYGGSDELSRLCNQLGEQLVANPSAAILCHMCAANIPAVTALWEVYYSPDAQSSRHKQAMGLLDLMEKLSVFQDAAQSTEGFALIAAKVVKFAELLASQGCLPAAISYMLALPELSGDSTTNAGGAALLIDRIYGHNNALLTCSPTAVFESKHIGISPVMHEQHMVLQQPQQQTGCGTPAPQGYGVHLAAGHGMQGCMQPLAGPGAPTPAHGSYDTQENGHYQPTVPSTAYPSLPVASAQQPAPSYQYTTSAPPAGESYRYAAEPAETPPPAPPTQSAPAATPAPGQALAAAPPPLAPAPAPSLAYQYAAAPAPPTVGGQEGAFTAHCSGEAAAAYQSQGLANTPALAPPPPPLPSYDPTAVVHMLSTLSSKCAAFNLPPLDKRKLDDVVKRLSSLNTKLTNGEISPGVFEQLVTLCTALGAGDTRSALDVHVQMTTSDWADNGSWLMGVKRLIEMTSKLGVTL